MVTSAGKIMGAGGTGGTTWDLDYAYYDDPWAGELSEIDDTTKTLNNSAQGSAQYGMDMSADGTKVYMLRRVSQTVYQHNLTTPWDLSSGSYASKSYTAPGPVYPDGLRFKPDGTKMYLVDQSGSVIYQYSLSTAWDVSTTSYDGKYYNAGAQAANSRSIDFNSDGTKMFVSGFDTGLYRYSLSTAWDVSTASYDSNSLTYTESGGEWGIHFKRDGTAVYVSGGTANRISKYPLSTAWDLSTAGTATTVVPSSGTYALGIFVKEDESAIYINDASSTVVRQHTLGGYDASAQDDSMIDLRFKPDGTKMYLAAANNDRIYEYALSTAWDTSTATYTDSTGVLTNLVCINFKNDGTKMYYQGGSIIYQYSLSPAWDVSTASYDSKSFNFNAQGSSPRGFVFKSDGTKVYVAQNVADTVYQYSLSTAWDISTASYDSVSLNVLTNSEEPFGMDMSDDGKTLFIANILGDTLAQYDLSTAWDLSTATYSKSMSLGQYRQISGVAFKPDGDGFFVVDYGNAVTGRVFTYAIGEQ